MTTFRTASPNPALSSLLNEGPNRSVFSLRRTTTLTLALLLVIAAIAGYGVFGVVRGAPMSVQYTAWTACGMLVLSAIIILLMGRNLTQRSLLIIERQLRALANDDELRSIDSPIPDDLKGIMHVLFEYVGKVKHRVDRLRLQKKELDIQMRVAEAERQNTEAIIFSISDAVIVIDSFGELVLANIAAEKLFGFRGGDWRHRPLERLVDDSSLVTLIKDARTTGEHSVRRQVEYSALRDGRTQTFNITLSTVVDTNGQSRGVVAVFHDITREREIAQVKSDFVSSVSHELRTPLSSIKAYVEMLLDGEAQDAETEEHFMRIIQSETERLQRLISNILNISRIESGVVEIHRESIQANDVINEVIEMMKPQAQDKELTLECDLEGSLPHVWADRDLLHQAVLNVVSNAVKYTNQGGRIMVRTDADHEAGQAVITTIDNGMGIRSQDLSRIFDKFYRARESSSVAKGTGLGLNLVKHIVETVHDGEISVSSEAGAGTTLTLRFPFMVN